MRVLVIIICILVAFIIANAIKVEIYYRNISQERLTEIWDLRRENERLRIANDNQAKILSMVYDKGVKFDWSLQ